MKRLTSIALSAILLGTFSLTGITCNITVPHVTGLSEAEARHVLETTGLAVGTVASEYSTAATADTVLRQDPLPRAEIIEGLHVDLVLSRGIVETQPLTAYTYPLKSGDESQFTTGLQSECDDMGGGPSFDVTQADGALHIVTQTVNTAGSWAGFWHSCNGFRDKAQDVLDPRAPLPWPIRAAAQPRIVGIYVRVKGHGTWRIELKRPVPDTKAEVEVARFEVNNFSAADYETRQFDVSGIDESWKFLNLVVETDADLYFDEVGFYVQMPEGLIELDFAFLAAFGQALRCYDPESGYVKDKSNEPLYELDSVPGLGFMAMAAACAADLGFVDTADAQAIAQQTISVLLNLPAHPSGWLPHWTKKDEETGAVVPHTDPNDKFSTVDTALAYLSAYTAAVMLNLESERADLLAAIRALDFDAVTVNGEISHGFDQAGALLGGTWTDFGAETTLVMVLAKLNDPAAEYQYDHTPPVYIRNGFIAEMAALLYPEFGGDPTAGADAWGVDWHAERLAMRTAQQATIGLENLLGGRSSCEIISVEGNTSYLASGADQYSDNWLAPHYTAMVAALDTDDAIANIAALRDQGLMTIMGGPAESILFDSQWDFVRTHTKQVVLNAWFNVVGYYHAYVAAEGLDDAVYAAAASDATLHDAVQAVFAGSD